MLLFPFFSEVFFVDSHIILAWADVTGAFSVGGRDWRYPTSEVRGRSREDPMPERRQAKKSHPTSEVRGCGREEQPTPEARGVDERSYPELPPAPAQEGLEELSHIEGQEGRR